jgi:putative transposase
MNENNSIIHLRQPDEIDDPLTALLRSGARRLLEQAVEAEVEAFLASKKDLKLADGRDRLVRHGHGPERVIQTGIGPVEVQRIKVRDRAAGPASERIRFSSALLPRWARRTTSLDALLPILYLRGVSAGDFQEALGVLLGKDAPNLSPAVIARLKETWADDYARWQKRDLSARRYVYVWADGVYLQARMEPVADCMLVMIGATPEGKKELLGFQVGVRESAQSWHELLIDLRARGLRIAPELAVADGALGFWKALDEVFPGTRHQRCWFHKTGNVLNKVAKSIQPAVKQDLREIWMAPDLKAAERAFDVFEKRRQVFRGCRVPDQGPRRPAGLLRLPRRALGPRAHHEPDRERLRHGPAPDSSRQGCALPGHRQTHGLQAHHRSIQNLAQTEGRKPVAQDHPGCQIPRRHRGQRADITQRRLTTSSPIFRYSSTGWAAGRGCCAGMPILGRSGS